MKTFNWTFIPMYNHIIINNIDLNEGVITQDHCESKFEILVGGRFWVENGASKFEWEGRGLN